MRRTSRVIAVIVAAALAVLPAVPVATAGPEAGGIDETVLVVGEDLAILPVPGPAGLQAVRPIATDMRLPAFAWPGPATAAPAPWGVPRPAEVLALIGDR